MRSFPAGAAFPPGCPQFSPPHGGDAPASNRGSMQPGATGLSHSGLAGNFLQQLESNTAPPPMRSVGSAFEFFGKPATGNAASSSGELPQNPQQ